MPYRRPKPSIVLGTVAALAIASPLAVWGVTSATGVRSTTTSAPSAVPTQIAEVVLAQVPDIVIPLKDITGLDLPDLHLSDLKKIPIPANLPTEIPLPQNLPLPPGISLPPSIQIPQLTAPGDIAGGAPAPAPAPAPEPAPAPAPEPAAAPAASPEEQFGTAVKEITRDTPFSMIALTSELGATAAKVRAQLADGSWGPWFATEKVDSRKDDKTTGGKTGTEPVFVGATKAVQVLVTKVEQAAAALPASGTADAPAAPTLPNQLAPADPAQLPMGFAPAALSSPLRGQEPAPQPEAPQQAPAPQPAAAPQANSVQQLAEAVTAVLIEPGTSASDSTLGDIATPLGSTSGPKVITRAQWGADESIRCQEPVYDDSLGGATVHHTAGSNDYSKSESVEIVRAIYAYHASTLGWCDVGYNVLVDKYGQIFEGRAGGLDRNVQGAHAGGFNENTMGIAMMGDFSTVTPPQETVNAVGKFLGWRLAKAGLDPKGRTTMYSEGTEFTPYAQGEAVDLPIIFAHRDVGNTSCPGDAGYAKLGQIRDIAAANLGGGSSSGVLAAAPNNPPTDNASPGVAPDAAAAGTGSTAGAIGALVGELLRLTDPSPIAQKWIAEGGDTGRLGNSLSGEIPVKGGNKVVKFTNGAIATSPNGGVWTVLGKIFETWQTSGLDSGSLGLPTSDEYTVPDGKRTDFEGGSLIFNEVTGIVTTILKTYNDAYAKAYQEGAAATPAAAPVAEAAPAPVAPPAPPAAAEPAPAPAG
ncbi:N-acetylmuramoyl-L-alanine amidase [Rhodococcus maanshanensis]|uniref:N-acetylmuramoyl-L-alanine amidase n=1 Tax=Rhodococcus maanshanensis TaxID=183556 RepID=UPI0022B2F261|nr:N-acetylmuramoyl-L-alanine amidase [Rhodococcus maanshanensis]MCZ4559032.1 N-acetylmuramoyl-L-alanine amidase [Rhodococcus maanshanensis]